MSGSLLNMNLMGDIPLLVPALLMVHCAAALARKAREEARRPQEALGFIQRAAPAPAVSRQEKSQKFPAPTLLFGQPLLAQS